MERMFNGLTFGHLELLNRFVFPPSRSGPAIPMAM
jgi:2,4-dienoyl-CoA reductase-like NADH-dependent reductase (Old Yellow Enzyme family)